LAVEARSQDVSQFFYDGRLHLEFGGSAPGQLETAAKTNDGDNRKLVQSGDFVINSRSDRKGSSGVSPLTGSVSLISIVLEPKGLTIQWFNTESSRCRILG
jgi:type I restriction enzyme, S subunit